MDARGEVFEAHRPLLEGLAYRMLGERHGARDVVQDTCLRWMEADVDAVREPRAWLVTVCGRLALNVLGSARARRESYVGTWLPEPWIDDDDPRRRLELDESVSVALMLALERLSPAERAAFLLHDVFGRGFDEVARILGRNEPACRKAASRGRAKVAEAGPRRPASPEEHRRLTEAFLDAARAGDLPRLEALLGQDVELHSDGGGRAHALPHVLRGAREVAAFFVRHWHHAAADAHEARVVRRAFNGAPGLLVFEGGRLATALVLRVEAGRVRAVYAHRNPDKLKAFDEPRPGG